MSIQKFGQKISTPRGVMHTTWSEKLTRFIYPKRVIYAKITGVALWAAWLASILFGAGNYDLAGQVVGTDYIQFYSAGLTILKGESADLYNFPFQFSLEKEIIGPALSNYHAFITPPLFAVLFIPFTILPYLGSFLLWSALGILFLYISIFLISKNKRANIFTWSLLWFPVFASISFGQNSLLSLAILSLVYTSWSKNKYLLSGFLASLLFYKPQLIIGVFVLSLLEIKKQQRTLIGLIIGTMVMILTNLLLFPEASYEYLDFVKSELPTMISGDQYPIWHLHTVRGFWNLLLGGRQVISDSLYLLSIIFITIGFYKFYSTPKITKQMIFAGVICYTILVTPHAMIYDWAILIIPSILLWQINILPKNLLLAAFTIIWIVTLISGPLTYIQLRYFPAALQMSVPLFILTLYALISYQFRRIPNL